MIKDSELIEVLTNGEARASDLAAVSRMQAHLEAALGAAFDQEVVRPLASASASSLRRLGWLGGGAIVVVSTIWLAVRPAAPEVPLAAARQAAPTELPVAPVSEPLAALPVSAPEPPAAPLQERRTAPKTSRKPQAGGKQAPTARAQSPAADSGGKATGLAEELSGLDEIRALMISSPQRALAAAEQQQQAFTRGALGPERALLRLDALLRLGRTSEAQQLAQHLLAAQADQPYRTRIRKLLERAK